MQFELVMRFDYGAIVPWVRRRQDGLTAIAGPDGLRLRTPIAISGEDLRTVATFEVGAGDRVPFVLEWFPSHAAARRHAVGERDPERHGRRVARVVGAVRVPGSAP